MLGFTTPLQAQIIPDASLGAESSTVTPDASNGLPLDRINGGAIRGSSLFHSFQEFSIPEGRGAYFGNPDGIANIITRVTGGNASNILGILGVQGNANLFLINPKGIAFGSNARLDLRGSFLASTADSLVLSNGFEFSATNPEAPPLLSVNIPIGLRFRENPGAILNESAVSRVVLGTPTPVGLEVVPTQTLALVGGDVRLNSGNLTALQGNILLGSVASPGFVGFVPTPTGLALDYRGIQNFGNIELSGTASVNTTGLGGGGIGVMGGNVTLRDRSNFVSDTLGTFDGRGITITATQFKLLDRAFVGSATLGTGASGEIAIRATDSVELKGIGFENFQRLLIDPVVTGNPPDLFNRESVLSTGTVGGGRAGNITIETRQLTLREGAVIISPAFGLGAAGNISITTAQLTDVSGSGILTTTFGLGKAGNLTIDTQNLTIRDEAAVSTATFGAGDGGDLIVRASDSVVLSEGLEISPFGTNLSTSTVGGAGKAGNLEINTRTLLVEEGATITSSSGATADRLIPAFGRGGNLTIRASESVTVRGTSVPIGPSVAIGPSRAQIVTATAGDADSGDLSIYTRRLTLADGGAVGASTVAAGKGGDIVIEASESVEVIGRTKDGMSPSGIATASGDVLIGLRYPTNPTGAAGNFSITTGRLVVRDGALVSVASVGSGGAGTLNVVTEAIALDNRGSIDASTNSGGGGNINIQARNIQLRRDSRISTDAGTSNGGNIRIDSEFLIAFPQGNSDITANARTAQGGGVTVNVPHIFGAGGITREQLRDRLGLTDTEFAALPVNPTTLIQSNDIAAISQAAGPSLQGTVTFSSSGINPAQGLVELPQTIVDPATLIAANPCVEGGASEFAIAGRGGLPTSPAEPLSDRGVRVGWSELPVQGQGMGHGAWGMGQGGNLTQDSSGTQDSGLRTQDFSGTQDSGLRTQDSSGTQDSGLRTAIIPAQGWAINPKGEVRLTAYNPGDMAGGRSPLPVGVCSAQ